MQRWKEKIFQKRISFEWGTVSLLSVALFFMLQILNVEASNNSYLATGSQEVSLSSNSVSTTVNVNENKVIQSVPADFVGFSLEPKGMCNFLQAVTEYPQVKQEFKNLGSGGIVRVGGISGDRAVWSPDGTLSCEEGNVTFNKQAIDDFFTFIKEIGWKAIWQVNFGANDPKTYANEANYVYKTGGSSLVAIEIGNEPAYAPDHGFRSSGYNFATYKKEWEAYRDAIRAYSPSIPLIGPSSPSSGKWIKEFAESEYSSVMAISSHYYPTNAKNDGATIENLLSKTLMSKTVDVLREREGYAQNVGLPFKIDEGNSASNGGKWGVSDSFAASLWGADYMFNALEQGVNGINFHGVLSTASYAPINKKGEAMALYYSLLFFHNAAPDGKVVSSSASSSANVVSHAVVGKDGKLKVVIINKDTAKDAAVEIKTKKAYSQASALYLTAPSVDSTSGITYGGNAVASDGSWKAGTPDSVAINDNVASIKVPSGSAAVVTFEKGTTSKYALTVKNGTGSGTYAQGAKIEITANTVSGKTFIKWTGDTKYVADVNSATITVTMPDKAIKLTATYKTVPSEKKYALKATVTSRDTKIEKGAKNVTLVEADLTNTGTETLAVSGLGIMADYGNNSVNNVKLYIDGKDIGSPAKIKIYEVVYKNLLLKIEAGKTIKLVLKGDISSNIKFKGLGFRLDSCTNIFTVKGATGDKKAKLAVSGKSYLYFVSK